MLIAIGNDHAGFPLKKPLMEYLQREGYSVVDCGCDSEEAVDYPDVAKITCDAMIEYGADFAILICGSGVGMCIAANKIRGIRAATTNDVYSARMAKEHNHANVISIGARVVNPEQAKEIVDTFIKSEQQGGRHELRVAKIMELEE